jgi:hypothetical protein
LLFWVTAQAMYGAMLPRCFRGGFCCKKPTTGFEPVTYGLRNRCSTS